jgi:hypothetical protein
MPEELASGMFYFGPGWLRGLMVVLWVLVLIHGGPMRAQTSQTLTWNPRTRSPARLSSQLPLEPPLGSIG